MLRWIHPLRLARTTPAAREAATRRPENFLRALRALRGRFRSAMRPQQRRPACGTGRL